MSDWKKHLVQHVVMEGAKSAGCMVTLLIMLAGVGVLSTLAVALIS